MKSVLSLVFYWRIIMSTYKNKDSSSHVIRDILDCEAATPQEKGSKMQSSRTCNSHDLFKNFYSFLQKWQTFYRIHFKVIWKFHIIFYLIENHSLSFRHFVFKVSFLMMLIETVRKFIYFGSIVLNLLNITFDSTELDGWIRPEKNKLRTKKKVLLMRFCNRKKTVIKKQHL